MQIESLKENKTNINKQTKKQSKKIISFRALVCDYVVSIHVFSIRWHAISNCDPSHAGL